jgi:hypothetical protein
MKVRKTLPLRQFLMALARLKAQVAQMDRVYVQGNAGPASRYEIECDINDDSIAVADFKLFAPTSDGEIRQHLSEAARQCEQLAQRISDLRYS